DKSSALTAKTLVLKEFRTHLGHPIKIIDLSVTC
ncbi:MAG: hypothetical protein ACI9EB_000263, partial [Pseudomonas sp.]